MNSALQLMRISLGGGTSIEAISTQERGVPQSQSSLLALTVLLFSAGCGLTRPPKEYDDLSRRALRLTQAHDWFAMEPLLDPGLTNSTARAQLVEVGDSLRAWRPDSVALIGWNVVKANGHETAQLSYELHGAHGWGAAVLGFERRSGGPRVNAFQLVPRSQSLASENALTLRGRTPRHFVFLAALAASVVFSFGTAIIVLRTPMPRRWWLAGLALVSFGAVQLNWSTGVWRVLPAWFTLFGGGIQKSGPVAPWIVSVGIPLGAFIALWRRAQFLKQDSTTPSEPTASIPQAAV
jgi:hypothetical protein